MSLKKKHASGKVANQRRNKAYIVRRYLKVFHDANLLNTSRGHNVQEQCKHLKGLWRAMVGKIIC